MGPRGMSCPQGVGPQPLRGPPERRPSALPGAAPVSAELGVGVSCRRSQGALTRVLAWQGCCVDRSLPELPGQGYRAGRAECPFTGSMAGTSPGPHPCLGSPLLRHDDCPWQLPFLSGLCFPHHRSRNPREWGRGDPLALAALRRAWSLAAGTVRGRETLPLTSVFLVLQFRHGQQDSPGVGTVTPPQAWPGPCCCVVLGKRQALWAAA